MTKQDTSLGPVEGKLSVSRVVAILTALLAPVGGWVATEATKLPGTPALDKGQVTAVFVAGIVLVGAIGWKWLEGRSTWEIETANLSARLAAAGVSVTKVLPDGQVRDDVAKLTAGLNALTEQVDALKNAPPPAPPSVTVGDMVFVPAPPVIPPPPPA